MHAPSACEGGDSTKPRLKGRGYSGGPRPTANRIAGAGKRRTEKRQFGENAWISGRFPTPRLAPDGRKTVGKTLSASHKKILSPRKTWLRLPPFPLSRRTTPRRTPMTDTPNSPDPAQAISQLGESLSQTLAQTTESQRALAKEMTGFAKDESLRFVNLRLERNGAALDKLQHCAGLPGLIGAQQEWLRD